MTKTPEEMAEEYLRYENESYYWAKHAFLAGYQAGRLNSEGVQAAKPQWISVKDRLPEDGVEVIVVSDGETCASWHEAGDFGWAVGGKVTHWMPLPEPPKEEK